MSKKMLINASHPEENRVAIVVDGILSELDIEIAGQEQTKGNIYKAVVVRVEPGLQAAFVDYGAEKMGFLQIGEIHPNLYPTKENQDTRNRPRINDILQRGQELLVQIVKEERGTKGAALTTFLSLPGRYMVLMPDSKTKGVSRKISDDKERKELKRNMAVLDLPERMGYIVRTAGIGKEPEELKRDFDYLVNLYQGILNRKDQVKAPAQLYQESNLAIRSIRDYFSTEMDEVLIDDAEVYRDAKDFFSLVMPEQAELVKQHKEKRPIFSRFQIEEQIDGLSRNQTPLPSGGSIVIDQTEALVAIDVNSGKMSSESGIEATAGKTNLEAATEIGRQLRLRDLGGLIVIDFIDMRDRKRVREVEDALRKSLRDDKAKVTVGRISQFGLLEMSRQRIKAALSVGAYLDCPHCQGKGRIRSVEAQAVALLRQLHAAASKGQIGKIEARVPLDVATYLLNEKRSTLNSLEKQLDLKISIEGRPAFVPGQVEVELHKREKQAEQEQGSAPISHANQIEDALAAAQQEKLEEEKPENVEVSEESAPAEETSGRKRRRRRRKRSDRREGTEQQSVPETTEVDGGIEINPAENKILVAEASSEESLSEETTSKPIEKKRSRSRSRRSSRKTAVAENADTAEAASPATETEVQPQEISVDSSDKQGEKPKRRSRRKSPVQKAAEANTEPSVESGQVSLGADPKTEKTEPPVNESETKKRPARKSAAKRKTAAPISESAPDVSNAMTGNKEGVAEQPVAKEKPQRRQRRKVKPAAEKEPLSPVQQVSTVAEEASSEKLENKPKRRTPRKTTASKTGETTGAVETKQEPTATDVVEKKPQRRTRRKTSPKTAEQQPPREQNKAEAEPKHQVDRQAVAAETNERVVSAEKPKRRPPRRKTPPKSEQPETTE